MQRRIVCGLAAAAISPWGLAQTPAGKAERKPDLGVQSRGNTVFVYDWARKPAKLDVSFDNEVSWSGTKQ